MALLARNKCVPPAPKRVPRDLLALKTVRGQAQTTMQPHMFELLKRLQDTEAAAVTQDLQFDDKCVTAQEGWNGYLCMSIGVLGVMRPDGPLGVKASIVHELAAQDATFAIPFMPTLALFTLDSVCRRIYFPNPKETFASREAWLATVPKEQDMILLQVRATRAVSNAARRGCGTQFMTLSSQGQDEPHIEAPVVFVQSVQVSGVCMRQPPARAIAASIAAECLPPRMTLTPCATPNKVMAPLALPPSAV